MSSPVNTTMTSHSTPGTISWFLFGEIGHGNESPIRTQPDELAHYGYKLIKSTSGSQLRRESGRRFAFLMS